MYPMNLKIILIYEIQVGILIVVFQSNFRRIYMRLLKSLKNSFYGIVSQVVIILIGFFSRKVFVDMLPSAYLGLNGLFSNVISILSLTELGFGTAAIYALYKPLADNDERKITALMNVYAKIYHIMFFVVMILGLCLMPVIPYLIKDIPDLPHIYFIYYLFVINSAISYLFAYKRSLLFADQKNYKISQVTMVCKFLLTIFQIVILYITQNYILYILIMIVMGFVENLIISKIVDTTYPYLKLYKKEKIDDATKHELIVNTKALLMHKIGSVAVFQTDNLITSAFVSIVTVGVYSNYTMIVNQLHTLIGTVIDGAKASIGNYNASETDENKLKMFFKLNFANHVIYSFCTTALFCLLNPFIGSLWLKKEEYVFSIGIVALICIYFYLRGMRYSYNLFKETSGVYNPDRYKAIFEAVMNIVASIILVHFFGFAGVLLGTIVTTLSVPYVIEVYVTFKYVFHRKPWIYYKVFAGNVLSTFIMVSISYILCNFLFPTITILNFIVMGCICVVVSIVINLIFYGKSEEAQYFLGIVNMSFRKIMDKRKVK